ncbi:DUF4178 domain-containing protein [Leeia sp.]|uniref:DUF4178 domain-containing protein n=1 Tax=Leeia sp. TaxID=2884678 RepID=UPI0035B350E7
MFKAACPGCGAELSFRSATSVLAICEYCQSTVARDADSVRNLGKQSAVLEDFSPLQIHSSGRYLGLDFSLIGRIQLQYERGVWNEWYLWFDDGSTGWLSDANGQYVLTRPLPDVPNAPSFDSLQPGSDFILDNKRYSAADVRRAQCVAGQGELPFTVGAGWEAIVADFRCDSRFLTLDYSEGQLIGYLGDAVRLEELQCQNLRTEEQIQQQAGAVRGELSTLSCPGCGSGITLPAGLATQLICPACHSQSVQEGGALQLVQQHQQHEAQHGSLSLGDQATINQQSWTVIGLQQCRELDSDAYSLWWEYLLFNPLRGFCWLSESDERWEWIEVLNRWPRQVNRGGVRHGDNLYTSEYQYGAEVCYAAGAFNWQVQVGDQTRIASYRLDGKTGMPPDRLYAEYTAHELTWSAAKTVPSSVVSGWFGKEVAAATASDPDTTSARKTFIWLAIGMSILLLVLNLSSGWLEYDDDGDSTLSSAGVAVLVGLVLIWLPIWLTSPKSDSADEDDD